MAGLRTERSSTVMKLALLKRKLARLDREWIRCRESALVPDCHGGHEPSAVKCVLRGGSMILLGIAIAVSPWLFPPHGLKMVLVGITGFGMVILCAGGHHLTEGLSKVSRFNRLRRRYQTRRREIVALIRHEQSR